MTGKDVKKVREAMEVNQFAFAAVLGVHPSSVYRWESATIAKIDPLQISILERVQARLTKPRRAGRDLGNKIRDALMSGGNLAGLRVVLDFILTEKP